MNLADKIKQLREKATNGGPDEFKARVQLSTLLLENTDNILRLVEAVVGQINTLDETEVTYDLREALEPFLKPIGSQDSSNPSDKEQAE